jgi:hypothetical protein
MYKFRNFSFCSILVHLGPVVFAHCNGQRQARSRVADPGERFSVFDFGLLYDGFVNEVGIKVAGTMFGEVVASMPHASSNHCANDSDSHFVHDSMIQ